MWVSPFRDLRLIGYLLLPAAFRSLSRLSSALSAKASTLRSFLLDLWSFDLHFRFYSVRNFGSFAFSRSFSFTNFCLFKLFGLFFSDVLIKIFILFKISSV